MFYTGILTAYAMRSPLGSAESWVGRPRSVLGEAARILSMAIDIFDRAPRHQVSWVEQSWRREAFNTRI